MLCFGEQFGSNRKLWAIKCCLEQQLVRESTVNYDIGNFWKTNSAISSLWSSAKSGVEQHPIHPREMLSLEKNHVVELNLLVVISRSRKQPMNSWLSQLPVLVFTHSCLSWLSRALQSCSARQTTPLEGQSCQAQPQGRQQENSLDDSSPRGVSPSSSPGHMPCAANSSRGGFLSGINCLNPSADLKNTGGWEEDPLEGGISSAKRVIFKLS